MVQSGANGRGGSPRAFEALEGRMLLSGEPWSPPARLIAQDQAVANFPNITGAGQAIVVIDSGVDYKHPSLGGGFGPGYTVEAGWDFMSDDPDPFPDTFAHGTGTAGVISAKPFIFNGSRYQGIAPGVKLIALRQSNSSQVKAALDWTIENRERYNITGVTMLDYGGPGVGAYVDEVKQLVADGVFIAHPAGNLGPNVPTPAGADPSDFAIGAVHWSGRISPFSQRGPELDLFAPGERMGVVWYDIPNKQHVHWMSGGTSWASPAAVATAALIREVDPSLSPAQIMRTMQDSGASVYDSATNRTYKRLNVNEAIKLAFARRVGEIGAPRPVPKPVPPPPPPPKQSPFASTPLKIEATGGTIEAELFDAGGEGLAYHDADAANVGKNAYRKETGVDVRTAAGGLRAITSFRAGEWIEYTVSVAQAGTFTLSARVGSSAGGGRFHLEVDGVDRTGGVAVPDTDGKWKAIRKTDVPLTAGAHVLRVKADAAGGDGYVGNLDWLKFTAQPPAIKATSYSVQKGVRRAGTHLTGLARGDWVGYKAVNFGKAGVSEFRALVAAPGTAAGRRIEVRLGSSTGRVVGTLTVRPTASWDDFQWQSTAIRTVKGVHDVYLAFTDKGAVGNVSAIEFV